MSSELSSHSPAIESNPPLADASLSGRFRGFLRRFVPAAVIIGFILCLVAIVDGRHERSVYRTAVRHAQLLQKTIIDSHLRAAESDLAALLASTDLTALVAARAAIAESDFMPNMMGFLKAKPEYGHIRILDNSGAEVVHVDGGRAGPQLARVPERTSASRRTLLEGLNLQRHERAVMFLATPTDHEDAAVVIPTIRFVAGIFDDANVRLGLLEMDLLPMLMLDDVRKTVGDLGTPLLFVDGDGPLDQHPTVEISLSARQGSAGHLPIWDADVWQAINTRNDGFIETPYGIVGYATLPYAARRRIRYGEPFLEDGALLSAEPSAVLKAVLFRPQALEGGQPRLLWISLTGVVMLGLAGFLCALLSREADRRARAGLALAASDRTLRQQLAFTETLLESLPTPVFVKDTQGRYIACNRAFESFVGVERTHVIGRAVEQLLPAEQAALHRRIDELVLANGEKHGYEAAIPDQKGSMRSLILFKSPFLDRGGAVAGLIGVMLDISDRKVAEEAERRSHAFLSAILNTIPQPIVVKDRQHRFVFVNDSACAWSGRPRTEILGRTDHEIFPKEQADRLVADDERVFAARAIDVNETTVSDARGEDRFVLTRKAVFTDHRGQEALVSVITDITDRKRAEQMLRLSAEVFEHSAEGILITDRNHNILSVNKAFYTITGYTADEVIGQNARILGSGQHDRAFFAEVFETIEKKGWWTGEMVNRRKSGELYVAEMPICAVRDDSGAIQRYIAIMGDITERKSSEETMRYLAQHDFLTGLANRNLLQDRIERAVLQARRNRRKVAILLIDLDRFKDVNDTRGHSVGDRLLTDVARRLENLVRQTDTVARLGGDEFVIVLPDLRVRTDADRVARKVFEELTNPFEIEGEWVHVGASVGTALFPDDAADAETLMRAADAAMYSIKQHHHQVAPSTTGGHRRPATQRAPTA